jgi:hypothetical protein
VGYNPEFRIVKVIIMQITATDSSMAGVDLLCLSCFKKANEFANTVAIILFGRKHRDVRQSRLSHVGRLD